MKKVNILILSGLAALSLGACGGASETAPTEPQESETVITESEDTEAVNESASETEIDEETMDFIKYNTYIELNNYAIEVLDNVYSYYMVVADEEEFSLIPDTGLSYGYDISYLNTTVLDDAELVADMEPAYETVDQLAKDLIPPMRTMMETFNQISDAEYSYADNQYQLPKELHPVIQENAAAFESAADAYFAAIDVLSDERVQEEEAKMLEEGNLINYYSSRAISIGNQIMDEAVSQGINDYNLTDLDLTNIKSYYEELKTVVENYETACADNEQLVKESLSTSTPFSGLFDSLLQSVEWMINQVESQTPLDEPSLSPLGSLGHVSEVLSQCIDRYNSVFAE